MPPTSRIGTTGDLSRSQVIGPGISCMSPSAYTTRQQGPGFSPSHVSKQFMEDHESRLVAQRIENARPRPKFIYKQAETDSEEENEQFTANPADDIPKNKLVDKLVRGLQHYI